MESLFLSEKYFNPLDNKKLNSLQKYLESLKLDTKNQNTIFFISYLRSLLSNPSSWKELIDGKTITLKNLNPGSYLFINSVKNNLKNYGFDISIKYFGNGCCDISIKLNLNEIGTKHLQNYIDKNKTPFYIMKIYNITPKRLQNQNIERIIKQLESINNSSEKVNLLIDVYKSQKPDLETKNFIFKEIKKELELSIINKDAKTTEYIFNSIFTNLNENDVLKIFDSNINNLVSSILKNSLDAQLKILFLDLVFGFKSLSKSSKDIVLDAINSQIDYLIKEGNKEKLMNVNENILKPRYQLSKNKKVLSFIKKIDNVLFSKKLPQASFDSPISKDNTYINPKLPPGITFANEQNIPTKTEAQSNTTSTSALDLLFDFNAFNNIINGKAELKDYFSVSLDLLTIYGLGFLSKTLVRGGTYLFKFLKNSQRLEEFKKLTLLEKLFVASNPTLLKTSLTHNIPLKEVIKNFEKLSKVKNPQKFLKNVDNIIDHGDVKLLFKNSKLIGTIADGTVYKITYRFPIYFSSALNIPFGAWVASQMFDIFESLINQNKILETFPYYTFLPDNQKEKLKNEVISMQLKNLGLTFSLLRIAALSQERFLVVLNKLIKENKPTEVLATEIAKQLNVPASDSFYSNFILPMVETFKHLKSKYSPEQINQVISFVLGSSIFVGLHKSTQSHLESQEIYNEKIQELTASHYINISKISELFSYTPQGNLHSAYINLLRYLALFGVSYKDGLLIIDIKPCSIKGKTYFLDLRSFNIEQDLPRILEEINKNEKIPIFDILRKYNLVKEL